MMKSVLCAAAIAMSLFAAPAFAQEADGGSARPDLESCATLDVASEGYAFGTTPIEVPSEIASIMSANARVLALLTLDGETACHGLAWVSEFGEPTWFVEGRLLGMSHVGYEAFGYWLVDRSGDGAIVETGARPVFAPSGQRFASVQLSDAGWGGIEGFAIWEMTADGPRQLIAQVAGEDNDWIPPAPFDVFAFDWRIDRWVGDDCVEISSFRYSEAPPYTLADDPTVLSASAENDWAVVSGGCS